MSRILRRAGTKSAWRLGPRKGVPYGARQVENLKKSTATKKEAGK